MLVTYAKCLISGQLELHFMCSGLGIYIMMKCKGFFKKLFICVSIKMYSSFNLILCLEHVKNCVVALGGGGSRTEKKEKERGVEKEGFAQS